MKDSVVVWATFFGLLGAGVNEKNREGAELYEAGRLDEALAAFSQAQIQSPDAPEIHYNLGNVHYRKQETEKALQEYRAALRGDPGVERRAHFNMGNVHYRAEALDAAVEEYKRALKIDPEDLEARQNLELALQRQQEQQQQQDQQGGDGGSGESGEEDKEESQPQSSESEPQPEPQPQEEPTEDQQASPGRMTQEDAERILSALAEMEKAEQQRQQRNQQAQAKTKGGKDW